VLDEVLPAFGAAHLLDVREHVLERAELLQQLRGGLVAIPGTPGMLSDVSPFSPMKSGISSGATP